MSFRQPASHQHVEAKGNLYRVLAVGKAMSLEFKRKQLILLAQAYKPMWTESAEFETRRVNWLMTEAIKNDKAYNAYVTKLDVLYEKALELFKDQDRLQDMKNEELQEKVRVFQAFKAEYEEFFKNNLPW